MKEDVRPRYTQDNKIKWKRWISRELRKKMDANEEEQKTRTLIK